MRSGITCPDLHKENSMRTIQKARAELRDFRTESRKRLLVVIKTLNEHASEAATFQDILATAIDYCGVDVNYLCDKTELTRSTISKAKNCKMNIHLNHRKALIDAIVQRLLTYV